MRCVFLPVGSSSGVIGGRVLRRRHNTRPARERGKNKNDPDLDALTRRDIGLSAVGVAVCWEDMVVFYMALAEADNAVGEFHLERLVRLTLHLAFNRCYPRQKSSTVRKQ